MTHAIGYMGPFEINFDRLAPGLLKYERRDGTFGDVATPPPKVDGIFFGYMERAGKQFEAVRVQYGDKDVCLKNPVRLILQRHTDGKGFGPSPAHISDGAASSLLEDMIRANPDQEAALSEILRAIGGRYRV